MKVLTRQVKVDSGKRLYNLHIPSGYADFALPVVIVLHGAFGNALSARWVSRMSPQAEKDTFFAVYPFGTGYTSQFFLTWNGGTCCGMASDRKVDDVAFIDALIDDLKNAFNVDEKRIYITGISNGGMLTHRLGRQLADRIAAIAPVQSCIFDEDTTTMGDPMNVLMFHGTADSILPYHGGVGNWHGMKFQCPPVRDSVNFWIQNNKCNPSPKRSENGRVVIETYNGGVDGSEVCFYTLEGGKHSWPGGRASNPVLNPPFKEISATRIMCEFFWNHPKS